ncbi:IQ domain-containing protein H-like isoform X2 [Anneissia japonica]|uniref:IQ domain-containing protein H-like isoform X2 n=1 Tax=Anneissia japonica TaxID=1529436 RepID=UPI0014258DDE|nr:IQ domain-containing protein H-like isoform X2 [Anneissia japonica]
MMDVQESPEQVGEILVKVQEDLQQLKDHLLQANTRDGANKEIVDIRALENAIAKTEFGIKARSEQILNVVNNRVTTLPSVDTKGKVGEIVSKQRALPRYTAIEPTGAGGPFGPSPGQQAKFTYNMKALHDPFSTQNRKLVNENYGISLPLIVERRQNKVPLQKPVTGSNVEHLAVLPRANRVDPQLIPPPISEKDAGKGILSLIERGLIPPAAELTLDPNPVRNKVVTLFSPEEKKEHKNLKSGDASQVLTSVKLDLYTPVKPPPDSPPVMQSRLSQPRAESEDHESMWAQSTPRAPSTKSVRSLVPVKNKEPFPPPTTPASEFKHLHHRFPIQHGKARENSKDFSVFKQHYCLSWGNISTTLKLLEKLLTAYAVPLAFVNGDRLADLALEYELEKDPSIPELLSVIINKDDVEALIRRPGRRYLGPNGDRVAATKIQSTWRRYKDRMAYLEYRRKKWAAGVIAISWIMNVKMSKIRKNLKATRKHELANFKVRSEQLKKSWSKLNQSRRTVIHLPSLGYSKKIREGINEFNIRQNLQMARLCDLKDENVDVIYISPVTINDEILQYYNKLLGLKNAVDSGNVENQMNVSNRFKVIIPEAINSFPSHSMCLASYLKYSPRALKRIENLIAGTEAYIVPGAMHKDDLTISEILGVPILGTEPEVAHLYSTKSGSKRVFASAQVDVPPSDYDVYHLQQIHESLAQLVTENLDVKRYLFKLDDEVDGRGIAYCDVTPNLRCHAWAQKEAERYGEKWKKKWAQEAAYIKIHAEIPDILVKHSHPVNTSVFPTWQKFLEAFLSQGGVIEACPPSESVTALRVNMLIEPTGKVVLLSSGDQIHAETPFNCWGVSVPQSSVEPEELNNVCYRVGRSCHQRGVVGYLAVDFVTFIDPRSMEQKLWAVDLNLWYDDSLAMTNMMLYLTGGKIDCNNWTLDVPPQKKEVKKRRRGMPEEPENEEEKITSRYAVMSTRLRHTNLAVVHYSVFFQMCRAHGIGFDIKERQGSVFTLIDSFKREVMGMLTVGDQLQSALASFARNLSIIHQEISAPNMQGETNFKDVIHDIEGILGTTIQNVDRAREESEAVQDVD